MGLPDALMDYLARNRNCRPGATPGVAHTCYSPAGVAHSCITPTTHSVGCSYGVCGSIEPGLETRLNRNRRIDQILTDEAFVRKNRPDLAASSGVTSMNSMSEHQPDKAPKPPAAGPARPVGLLSRMKDALATILE